MGRESLVACIPTSPSLGESAAPMENSPPGIQTIPEGVLADGLAVFATVGPNPAVVEAVVVVADSAGIAAEVLGGAGSAVFAGIGFAAVVAFGDPALAV